MKKIIVFAICALLIFAMPTVAFAESPSEEEVVETEMTTTEKIADYLKGNAEEIIVVVLMALASLYEARVRGKMNGSIGTLNNNAITVAENSAKVIKDGLAKMETIGEKVASYEEKFTALFEEYRKTAEEKITLETLLKNVEAFLVTAKSATLELANEVAELLVLANIPNSKKDELYSRHIKAIQDIEQAEEAITNDGEES
jgi:hypothetical protein